MNKQVIVVTGSGSIGVAISRRVGSGNQSLANLELTALGGRAWLGPRRKQPHSEVAGAHALAEAPATSSVAPPERPDNLIHLHLVQQSVDLTL